MVNKYIKGIVFVLLMISVVSFVVDAIIIEDSVFPDVPSGTIVNGSVDSPATFIINVSESANFTWDLDGVKIPSETENMVITSNYIYTPSSLGISNITVNAVAVNDSSTLSHTWLLNATNPPPAIYRNPSSSSITTSQGDTQFFNASSNQDASFEWYVDDDPDSVQSNNSVAASTWVYYSNNSAGIGTHSVRVVVSNANGDNSTTWTWNVIASPGPDPVSGLTVAGKGATWINWTWTNPGGNFNHSIVKINGSLQTNTSYNYYNHTLLNPGAPYTIALQTVDTFGAVNSTMVQNLTSTLNTPSGSNVAIAFSNLNITYSQINGDGNTSVAVYPVKQAEWGDHTFSNVGNYYDIQLTGTTTSDNITVELNYNPSGINESNVRLYHWNSAVWEDITTNLDTITHKVRGNVSSLSPFVVGVPPGPKITRIEPDANTTMTIGSEKEFFKISVDQVADITWKLDNTPVSNTTSSPGVGINYSSSASTGNHTMSVTATNVNGTATLEWNWTVRPKTYRTGNRVWDATKGMSTTYTWNPYSFSGFYYNLDSDLGTENLEIKNIDRSLGEGDIIYSTSPQEVNFTYSRFGSYQVIGFMAEKYFAGYTSNTNPPGQTTTINQISTLSAGQLHKVLLDDKDKRTISEGGTFTLKEGYVLQVKAVDVGAGPGQIWYVLLKDGSEVDQGTLAGDQTYVYQASRIGGVTDLPIIIVHFTNVFRGREINAAFIEGVFQISDSPTYVKSGDRKGIMEVTSVSSNQITMKNENTVDLSPGVTRDLMGNLKIMVADSSVLRFGLTTEISGSYELRGTIYNATEEWTPMNFGLNTGGTNIGFYYDIDGDVGNETLKIVENLEGKRQIAEDGLVYSTTPQEVDFEYSKFGSYQVIGFMAEKYFAGYTSNSEPADATSSVDEVSTLSSSQLHKVLLDDSDKRTISEGGTITLKEGYVLQVKAVDIGAGPGQIWYVLLKDGNEVDQGTLAGGQTYVYKPSKVGGVSDLPILFVHFTSVFRGREINAAFIEGVFQISDSPKYVKSGDREGNMEVTSVSSSQITMKNKGTISLSSSSTSDVMGNIKFRVADSSTLRFYPFVTVTENMIANQLVIDAPSKANAGDVINIKVTAGGNAVGNASLSIDSTDAGQTDSNGILNYTLPKTLKGNYNITATKLGYQKAIRSIEILQYVEYRLSMEIPAKANQFETIAIKVTYNGTAVNGATVTYDNATIGTTDSNGTLNYKLETSGTHTVSASKTRYITVAREIEVRAPYTEYKALDINVTPEVIFSGQKYLVRSNITNVGTKADTLPVVLLVNESVAGSINVTIDPGKTQEINFTKEMTLPKGNYTVEILDQKKTVEVKEEPLNYLLIGVLATGLGAIAIYILTAKNKISLDAIKNGLNVETMRSKLNVEAIKKMLEKSGKKGI